MRALIQRLLIGGCCYSHVLYLLWMAEIISRNSFEPRNRNLGIFKWSRGWKWPWEELWIAKSAIVQVDFPKWVGVVRVMNKHIIYYRHHRLGGYSSAWCSYHCKHIYFSVSSEYLNFWMNYTQNVMELVAHAPTVDASHFSLTFDCLGTRLPLYIRAVGSSPGVGQLIDQSGDAGEGSEMEACSADHSTWSVGKFFRLHFQFSGWALVTLLNFED